MPPGSRYRKYPVTKEKVFIDFYEELDKKIKTRIKISRYSKISLTATPAAFAVIAAFISVFFWDDSNINLTADKVLVGFVSIILAVFIVAVNLVFLVWSKTKPNEKAIARKIFTAKNFQTCDASSLRNFNLVSKPVKEAIKRNLKITEEDIKYMNFLVTDGYQGSFYDLCQTVKKL